MALAKEGDKVAGCGKGEGLSNRLVSVGNEEKALAPREFWATGGYLLEEGHRILTTRILVREDDDIEPIGGDATLTGPLFHIPLPTRTEDADHPSLHAFSKWWKNRLEG